MTLQKNRIQYSPLSIDGQSSSPSHPRLLRGNQPRRNHVVFLLFSLFASLFGLAVLILKDKFHLSLWNLFRTAVGGSNVRGSIETVCFDNNDGSQKNVHESFKRVSINELQLTKKATGFSKTFTDDITSNGFMWDETDAATTQWRPQGITTYLDSTTNNRWVLVSWYGRKDEGFANYGGRISFVDVSLLQQCTVDCFYPYIHVLLVDSNYCTLPNIHVGGIEQVNGTLYVTDSRAGMQQILTFDMDNLYEVSSDEIFGYSYVLRQSSSFPSPTKPSFLSYDVDNNKFVIGTYARCGPKVGIHTDSQQCFEQQSNRLVWFDPADAEKNTTYSNTTNGNNSCWHYFSEMQGAASAKIKGRTIVWISSSYGAVGESHLHVVNMSTFNGECSESYQMNGMVDLNAVTVFVFPPGLEDLHIEQWGEDRFMWMNTEFGNRAVFATSLVDLLPQS